MFKNRSPILSIVMVITFCILCLSITTSYAAINKTPGRNIPPSITVIEPTNSTVWVNHEYHKVTWKSTKVTGNVRIEIWKDGSYFKTLADSVTVGTSGAGSHQAYIGSAYYRSGKYQVKVISLSNEGIFGMSPMFFINEKIF